MALIKCTNVSFAYDGKIVLSGVDFEVNHGDYLCILGENGGGKSTLINGLLKLKLPKTGSIMLDEGLKHTEIGYMPQHTEIQKRFPASVFEVVLSGRLNSLGKRSFYSAQDRQEALSNMHLLGIEDIKNKNFTKLSTGQQQRALLARALSATKKLLLLDEPTSGLDPSVTEELYQLINSVNKEQGVTIIMVSHDVETAINYSDHILHLGHRQLFWGTAQEYLKSDMGELFFGGHRND